ncbi:MAG: hypothetical protein AABY86_04785 [Bdellovibrionota bacterium]
MAMCKFCSKEITWFKEGRKNIPLNADGGTHSCEQMKRSLSSVRTIEREALSPEEIARYEKQINTPKKK